jgi:hypothetical protein
MNDQSQSVRSPQPKLIENVWKRSGEYDAAQILSAAMHPEGIDLQRIRFLGVGTFVLARGLAHIVSFIKGKGILYINGEEYTVKPGVHCYFPLNADTVIEASASGLEFVQASSANARGETFLLRSETFLKQSPRWVQTLQYLSRRIFLHHDQTLLSKSGRSVSWFHTTMFDTSGLPVNAEGQPVFKMQYDSRTEFNVVYLVEGEASVRFAHHPYDKQMWSPWCRLNGELTYHLNETEHDAPITAATNRPVRNRHEVLVTAGGSVSLFCLFDPAPVGIERHRPGEYTDYPPFEDVAEMPEYRQYKATIEAIDAMIDFGSKEENRLLEEELEQVA